MAGSMRSMKFKYVLLAFYSIVVVFLLASVIHSGFWYQFDPDELFHINAVFLLQHLVPYRDFFTTYTPLFHWFLAPLSVFVGFTFQLFESARVTMIILFIIRLVFLFFVARKLFGKLVAYLFIPLTLFDSFTVFSGMQVRPDNLMMTFYVVGLFFIVQWYVNKKQFALPLAGALLSLSTLTMLKNIPATLCMTLFVLIELYKTKKYRDIGRFILALALPFVIFALWASYRGICSSMIQQILFDAKYLNDTLRYPENILNYYWPPNLALFGFPGRPLTWIYEICLPLFAFAGMYTTFLTLKTFSLRKNIVGWLAASCLLQWASLLFVRSVFIQYFLSVSWFLALFASLALKNIYEHLHSQDVYRYIATATGICMLSVGLLLSWRANNTRAAMSMESQKTYLEAQWRIVPATATVFPGMVFRKSVYPLGLGFGTNFIDISQKLVKRYGSPSIYLERYRVPYVLVDPQNFSYFDTETQEYIRNHYEVSVEDQTIWIRGGF